MTLINKECKITTLPVSKNTKATLLATASVNYLKSGNVVYLDCIGVAANYIATKAIILINSQLFIRGLKLMYTPIFQDFELKEPTDGKSIKTGIRWVLTLDNNGSMVISDFGKDVQN